MSRSHLVAPFALALALALAACSQAESPTLSETETAPAPASSTVSPRNEKLHAWLLARETQAMAPLAYSTATIGDGAARLTLVYFRGPEYCGSGGCNLLVLRSSEAGYDVLGELTVVQTPIRVLTTSTNGLPDLGVAVSGGGAKPHEALVSFDGRRYASNPTVPPARPIEGAQGVTAITDETPSIPLKEQPPA